MIPSDPAPDPEWLALEPTLRRQKKATLIRLIQELAAISPTVQQFLQARYRHSQDMATQVQPYQARIEAQFALEEMWPDFRQIEQAIQEYQLATGERPEGTAELYVYALGAAAGFMWGMGIHDVDFYSDLAALAWQCVAHFNNFPALYPLYVQRLRGVAAQLNKADREGLIDPFYQLAADMDDDDMDAAEEIL